MGRSGFLWAGSSLSLIHPSTILMSSQAKFSETELEAVAGALGIEWIRHRGIGPMPPTDPVIYRLYEVCHAVCKQFKKCCNLFRVSWYTEKQSR
jgi:cyanate lyase